MPESVRRFSGWCRVGQARSPARRWCSYSGIAKDESLSELQKPFIVMRDALQKNGRDIVYSLCQYGMGNVWEWGADVGGNYWRTTGDLTDVWSNMSAVGFRQAGREQWSKPGHWTDPDMQREPLELWARPLADGTVAAGLFNRGLQAVNMTATWQELGLWGSQPVRDVWGQKDLGSQAGAFTTRVPAHGVVMVKIGRAR